METEWLAVSNATPSGWGRTERKCQCTFGCYCTCTRSFHHWKLEKGRGSRVKLLLLVVVHIQLKPPSPPPLYPKSMYKSYLISAPIYILNTDVPSPADNFTCTCHNHQCKAVYGEETEEVLVHFSWNPSENAEAYTLQVNNSAVVIEIRSLESSATLLLQYGNYSATLCVLNRCGKACSNHSTSIPRPEPQQNSTTGKIRRL